MVARRKWIWGEVCPRADEYFEEEEVIAFHEKIYYDEKDLEGDHWIFPNRLFQGIRPARVAWRMYNGPVPEGHMVMECKEESGCVNPSHSRMMSYADAVQERAAMALARGKPVGRPKARFTRKGIRRMFNAELMSVGAIAATLGITEDMVKEALKSKRQREAGL